MVIGMIKHILVSESGTVLRTMPIAGTLADAAPARAEAGHDPPAAGGGGPRGGAGGGCNVRCVSGSGHADSGAWE